MKVLVTGSLGFIGSHLTDALIELGYEVVGLDGLKTGSSIENVNTKATYEIIDLFDKEMVLKCFQKYQFDQIFHLAAESHVDRSIQNAQPFIDSNITGTYNLYEAVKLTQDLSKLKVLLFSTDELMGQLTVGSFKEEDLCQPKNLYSMTKQAQEAIARSYFFSNNIQTITSRCSNIYGPRQFTEKFLPTIITSIQQQKPIPIYGSGNQVREWSFVKDAVNAAIFVIENGNANEVYHIGSGIEKPNIDVVKFVLGEMKASEDLISYVQDRLGHDVRYSLCVDKVNKMGWKHKVSFEEGFKHTIEWYQENERY